MTILTGMADAMRVAVRGDTELVVHDLRHPERSIVQIINGHISDRHVGQAIIAGLFDDKAFDATIEAIAPGAPNDVKLVSGYTSRTKDGRVLESSSLIVFDPDGRPMAAICVNVDPAPFNQIQRALDALAHNTAPNHLQQPASEPTVEGLIDQIIEIALGTFNVPVSRMSKSEKVAAVATMHERGLFLMKGAVEMVAKRMKTTRFTIYNYLDEIGKSR
ncbi:MAG: hypothetical protein BGP10_16585 [Rhodanobacter sp. 68-29]|nr:PAS domain-containing protein [Rhodanobacter sp.]ODU74994.1 MAG: hypothetical protein ABT17_05895 [Rhodanobacter sp. SCN 69-32]OJY61511.1 MAG: hypothetical protein BGP10_16585 [Rhodanobacter sp. 68-29]